MYLPFYLPFAAVLVHAAPAPAGPANTAGFTIPLVKNANARVLDGPAQRRKTFRKMGWTLPESLNPTSSKPNSFDLHIKALAANPTPVIPGRAYASPEAYSSEYLCPVQIGTPPQTLMLNFDTGSADLWTFSRYMDATSVGAHTAFNPYTSTTFMNDTTSTWKIMYADQSGASGLVGYDTVSIGGISQKHQALELATAVSSQFADDTSSDGLVGLGFDVINEVRPKAQQSWFQHVKHALDKRVFSVNLREDGSGFYQFGKITPGSYTGALTRVPTNMSRGWWEFQSTAFAVNGTVIHNQNQPSPAIADTGTTLLLVDPTVAQYYYKQIPGSGYSNTYAGYLFPCNIANTPAVPTFGVSMGSADFIVTIPRSILTYGPVDSSGVMCYGAVQSNAGYPLQIMGDVLYRSAFIAHLDWRGVAGTNGFLGLSVGKKS